MHTPQVTPWAMEAKRSVEEGEVFTAPDASSLASLKHLATLDIYAKTVKPLLDAMSSISKALLSLKGGKNDLHSLHEGLLSGSGVVNSFQAG